MRAKLISFFMLLTVSLTISAQQKKVAVYMTGEESGVKKVLGDQLAAAFARSGKYIAVERTASFLAELRKEHSYERTGAVKDSEIAALGIQFGVNYVCVADISEVFGEKYISARLIDVETAEIVNTHNVSGQMNSMNQCLHMANEISQNLTKGTFAEQAESQRVEAERAERERIRKIEEEKLAKERRLAELKAQGYVDLGLPSGTMWKSRNENGYYNYNHAIRNFGKNLPTKKQWEELYYHCKWSRNGWDYKITGDNGNYIILTTAGKDLRGEEWLCGQCGFYWTSTPCSETAAWVLYFDITKTKNFDFTRYGFGNEVSVRLVHNP